MKNTLNTALLPFACAALMLVHCAKKKEDPGNTGQPQGDTMADAEAVRQAKNALMITYASGDSDSRVTENITLPLTGADGVSITWTSGNEAVIDVETTPGTGMVTRPPGGMNTMVTLNAFLRKNNTMDTRAFTLTVSISEDGQAVLQAKDGLMIGYAPGDSDSRVTENITLPLTGANGVSIAWASDDDDVIDVETTAGTGMVTWLSDMNTMVILTATLMKNGIMDTRAFTLTVSISEDGQAVLQAKNALMITYASGESAAGVTADMTLPTSGADGVSIAWASNNAAVNVEMTAGTGMVTRPGSGESNAEVTLTATLTKGSGSDTKEFMLTILVQPANDAAAILQAKNALMITYASGDSDSRVTENIMLPLTGANGVTVAWASDDDDVIDVEATAGTGTVTRPFNTANATVTLTATLTKGTATSQMKAFSLTVIARLFAWSKVALAEGSSIWSARRDHATVVFDNKMWVMGGRSGRSGTTRFNDVWWSSDGENWTNAGARGPAVEPATDPVTYRSHWSAREYLASVVFSNKMWVLGGSAGTTAFDDVWSSSDGTTWTEAATNNSFPGTLLKRVILAFGGQLFMIEREFAGQSWFSSDGAAWTETEGSTNWPRASIGHAAVVFNNKMWFLGGVHGGTTRTNEVFSSTDGINWTNANPRGPAVEPATDPVTYRSHWSGRNSHAAVTFDDKIWVMGGNDGSRKNDVWWSSDGTAWTKLTNGSSHWSAREGHTVVVLGDKMFLMGGWTGSTDLKDVWVYQQTN